MPNFKAPEPKSHTEKNIDFRKSHSTFGAKDYFNRRSSTSLSSPAVKPSSMINTDFMNKYLNLSAVHREEKNGSNRKSGSMSNLQAQEENLFINSKCNNSGNISMRSTSFISDVAKNKLDLSNTFNDSWIKTESELPFKEINNNSIYSYQDRSDCEKKLRHDSTFELSDRVTSGNDSFRLESRNKTNVFDTSIKPDLSSDDSCNDELRSAPNFNLSTLSSNTPFIGFSDSITFGKGLNRMHSLLDDDSSTSSTVLAPSRPNLSAIQEYSNAFLRDPLLDSDDSIIESSQPLYEGKAFGRKSAESCTRDRGNSQSNDNAVSLKSYTSSSHSGDDYFQTNKNKTCTKFYSPGEESHVLKSKIDDVNLPRSMMQEGNVNITVSSDKKKGSTSSIVPLNLFPNAKNATAEPLKENYVSDLPSSFECNFKAVKEMSTCGEGVRETQSNSSRDLLDNNTRLGSISIPNKYDKCKAIIPRATTIKPLPATVNKEQVLLKDVDDYFEPNDTVLNLTVKSKQHKQTRINTEQCRKFSDHEKSVNTKVSIPDYKAGLVNTEKQSVTPNLKSNPILKSSNIQTFCNNKNVTNSGMNKLNPVPCRTNPETLGKVAFSDHGIFSVEEVSSPKCVLKPVLQEGKFANVNHSISGFGCGNPDSAFRPISRGLPEYKGVSSVTSSFRATETSSVMELEQIYDHSKSNSYVNPGDTTQKNTKQRRSQTPYISESFIKTVAINIGNPSPKNQSSNKTSDKSKFVVDMSNEPSDNNLSTQKSLMDKLETNSSKLNLSKQSVPASTESSVSSLFLSPLVNESQKMNFTRMVNTDANNVTLEGKINKKVTSPLTIPLPKPSRTYTRKPSHSTHRHEWFQAFNSKKKNNPGSRPYPMKKKKLFNLQSNYKESSGGSGDSIMKASVVPVANTLKHGKSDKATEPVIYDIDELHVDEDEQISNFNCFKRNQTHRNSKKTTKKNLCRGSDVLKSDRDGLVEDTSRLANCKKPVAKTGKNPTVNEINLRRSARNRRQVNYREISGSDGDKSQLPSEDVSSSFMNNKAMIKNIILKNTPISNDKFSSTNHSEVISTWKSSNCLKPNTQKEVLNHEGFKSAQCTKIKNYKTGVFNPKNIFDFTEEDGQYPIVTNSYHVNSKLRNNESKIVQSGKTRTKIDSLTESQFQNSDYGIEVSSLKDQEPIKRISKGAAQIISDHKNIDEVITVKNPSGFIPEDGHSNNENINHSKSSRNPMKKSVCSSFPIKSKTTKIREDLENNNCRTYDSIGVTSLEESPLPVPEKRKRSKELARNIKKMNVGCDNNKGAFSSPKVINEKIVDPSSVTKKVTVKLCALVHSDEAFNKRNIQSSSYSSAEMPNSNENVCADAIIDNHNPISLAEELKIGKPNRNNYKSKSEKNIPTVAESPENKNEKQEERTSCHRLLSSIKTSLDSLSNDFLELNKLLDITEKNN